MAIDELNYPVWYVTFIEVETNNEVIIKVVAKNKNEALKKAANEIVRNGKIKPMHYNQISCI